jgi:hypothetical protein
MYAANIVINIVIIEVFGRDSYLRHHYLLYFITWRCTSEMAGLKDFCAQSDHRGPGAGRGWV